MMKIKTNASIFNDQQLVIKTITKFWDKTSPAWRDIWGVHIHHGYYEGDETPAAAQEKLLKKLTQLLTITPAYRILDIGCGMGASSIYLAKEFQANVAGISLSHKQIEIAKRESVRQALDISFQHDDAHILKNFTDNTFDLVWSLESAEQFYDKSLFLQQAHRVLKKSGQLMIATWCSDREEYNGKLARDYIKLCRAFDTPYMPTKEYYKEILLERNFSVEMVLDWSEFVKKSWSVGLNNINNFSWLKLLPYFGFKELYFLSKLKLMRQFFEKGLIRYAVFVAKKN